MSISIRQIFPPAAKFTEKNLADQTDKVRNSPLIPIITTVVLSPAATVFLFNFIRCLFALKSYNVLPDPYAKEPDYRNYSSMVIKLMAFLGIPCDWRECRHRPRARKDPLRA